jgi:nucleoside-diphosphate-sugar epimerase
MNQTKTILLTGVTGVLGKRIAYELAKRGHRLICPVRAGSEPEAQQRFEKIFAFLREIYPDFEESLIQRFVPVPGDVRQKDLGLPAALRQDPSRFTVDEIWHLAALLDLTESRSQDVYNTNLVGTLNVLGLMREHRIPRLHYVSTFGSSGKIHEGIALEVPGIKPPSFRNTYERTKWEAERHVWQAQLRGEINATIYRPSIVVGDSTHGRYEQFNVFNHPFDVTSRVRRKLCEKQKLDPANCRLNFEMRISGDANATLNIIPMDFAIGTIMKLYEAPNSTGQVYHVVNPNPPSLRLMMEIFKRHEPWEGLRWEPVSPEGPFKNAYEKFLNRQIEFLMPYLMGEAIYDCSNVRTILGFHGGLPPIDNNIFLDAISRRGFQHGWQEVNLDAATVAAMFANRSELGSGFVWPEGSGLVVDFSPQHPAEQAVAAPPPYSMAERFLGRIYQMREKVFSRHGRWLDGVGGGSRDVVLVPFGMGVTRRGESEAFCYQHNRKLADQVFARVNQAMGFDLEAFACKEIPGHVPFENIHDQLCWALADDLVHTLRLFRDMQAMGVTDLASRLQVLPYSGGTFLAGWLSGIISFNDMVMITNQSTFLYGESENLTARREVDRWFFGDEGKLSEGERQLLARIRPKLESPLLCDPAKLADRFHGRLELVFSLNARVLEQLIEEIREKQIGVAVAITMSPNTVVFAGSDLEIQRFRELLSHRRKIELRRVPIGALGTPHCARLNAAAEQVKLLLREYDRQGRLRDPLIPFPLHTGELVRTRADFIEAVAGVANECCYFHRMIEQVLDGGGRHFLLAQSGLVSTAGDLFDGVIRSVANARGCGGIQIHRPPVQSPQPHPICSSLSRHAEAQVPDVADQSLEETIRWYESQLSALRASKNSGNGKSRGTNGNQRT